MGAKQQEVESPAVKMPPPPSGKPLPASLSEYFPYVANLGNLGNMLPEMAGIHGSRSQLWAHTALKLARLQTDAYFNGFFAGHTAIVPETCRQLQLRDGKNALGEFARRYDLRLFPNYIFLIRPDIDPSKFMKNKWPKVSAHLANPCIKKFLSQYHDLMPAFFTADEIMGQNADVMLRVHKELKKIIPQGIETFPYLRSADNDLMPYLPVFLGDFYPIKRHDFSGRNPWAVEREFAPLVKKAGDQPVWFMPQGFGSAPERGYCLPTAGEIRLMLNIAIGTGVRGIIWYGFPCGTLAWELNYSSCYYSLLGSGGQTGKGWNAVIEIGRNLAGLGPLLCRSRPAGLPKDICLKCRNFKDPLFYNGPAIKLYPLRTPQGKLIIAVNQNPRAPEKGTLKLPEGKWFDFSNLKPVNSQTVKLELPAGGARYLYNGSNAEINLVFKSRLHREIKRYLLQEALLTANGLNGLNLTGLEKLPPRQGLAEFQRRRTRLDREIANSAAGKMLRLLEQTKQNIDKLDFLFATHMKTLVTPEMRRATPRYRRWAKNPDQELQQARETLRNLFYEYNRLNDKLWNGSASAADMLSKAKTLKKNSETAHSNIQALLNRKSKAEDVDNPLI
jgi:hypothetical protein